MANVFDGMKLRAWDTVARTMGYDAVWIPAAGAPIDFPDGYLVRILFNNPTEKKTLAGIDYDPVNWKMEYRLDQLPGLKQAADAAATAEVITIDGNDYLVRKVDQKFDGQVYIAILEPRS